VGALSVSDAITASGSVVSGTAKCAGGGGAGGGIMLSGRGGLSISSSLTANGGAGYVNSDGAFIGGGGGRIALAGMSSYTFTQLPSGLTLNGGNAGNSSGGPGFAGVITLDALQTDIPNGVSVTLTGGLITAVNGSTTQNSPTVEVYIRHDLLIFDNGTASLGINNALQHFDSAGNNITDLNVEGTFNLNGFSQAVNTLENGTFFPGTIVLPAGSTLTVGTANGSSTFTGGFTGTGALVKVGTGTQTMGGTSFGASRSPNFTGSTTIAGGVLAIANDIELEYSTVTLAGGSLGFSVTDPVLGALAGTGNLSLSGLNSFTVGANNGSTSFSGNFSSSVAGGLVKSGIGTWTLTGTNTQSGPFTVQAGIVLVGANGALSPSAPITVSAGATLDLNGYAYAVTSANALTVQGSLRLGGAGVTVASGGTATYNGGTISNGFLRGAGTHTVTGGAMLTGVTTFASTTINVIGAGTFQNFSNGGTLSIAAGLASPTTFDGFTNEGSGSITVGQNSPVNAADSQSYGTLTLNPGSFNGTSGGVTQITNTGASPLTFNGGSRTFISTVAQVANPNAGIDLHGNDAEVAGGLFVNNGFVYDSVGSGTHRIIADYGSLVKGAGFYQPLPRTINGGTFIAGNSPGHATTGTIVLGGPNDPNGGLSDFTWQINNAGPSSSYPSATGVSGPSANAAKQVSGWGTLLAVAGTSPVATTGNFQWDATPSDKLTIHLQTLLAPNDGNGNPASGGGYGAAGDNTAGLMSDFDSSKSYLWKLFAYQGTYTGPTDTASLDASTVIDDSGFLNPHPGRFDLVLVRSSKEMDLMYTPTAVPEPGTLLLMATAGIGLFRAIRRGRRR
jgi:autotransporter-associated beta strand protein